MSGYDSEIFSIAAATSNTIEFVRDVANGKKKTKHEKLAKLLGTLTEKPWSSFMFTDEELANPMTYRKVPSDELALPDLTSNQIFKLFNEVRVLEVAIMQEMFRRIK